MCTSLSFLERCAAWPLRFRACLATARDGERPADADAHSSSSSTHGPGAGIPASCAKHGRFVPSVFDARHPSSFAHPMSSLIDEDHQASELYQVDRVTCYCINADFLEMEYQRCDPELCNRPHSVLSRTRPSAQASALPAWSRPALCHKAFDSPPSGDVAPSQPTREGGHMPAQLERGRSGLWAGCITNRHWCRRMRIDMPENATGPAGRPPTLARCGHPYTLQGPHTAASVPLRLQLNEHHLPRVNLGSTIVVCTLPGQRSDATPIDPETASGDLRGDEMAAANRRPPGLEANGIAGDVMQVLVQRCTVAISPADKSVSIARTAHANTRHCTHP